MLYFFDYCRPEDNFWCKISDCRDKGDVFGAIFDKQECVLAGMRCTGLLIGTGRHPCHRYLSFATKTNYQRFDKQFAALPAPCINYGNTGNFMYFKAEPPAALELLNKAQFCRAFFAILSQLDTFAVRYRLQ